MAIENNESFLGRGWGFPVRFDKGSAEVSMAENEEDIQQSIIILLTTMRRERVLLPGFGTKLKDLIFEPINVTTANIVTKDIEDAFLFYETRVTLDAINYNQDVLNGRIELTLEYTINATNSRRNLVFPFYFIEGTDI